MASRSIIGGEDRGVATLPASPALAELQRRIEELEKLTTPKALAEAVARYTQSLAA
jgi:hypothetical protein